jgi:NAD(P)-dependent dehydrogenase (short-subunit alcohol dehydrogenase family)
MPSSQNKVLVVVAAGPLIGVAVSTLFIVKGFTHVALISRSLSRLSENVKLILQRAKESGTSDAIVKAYVGDVSNPENITSILKQIEADLGTPEVVVYNAAVISRGERGDFTEEELIEEFKVRCCYLS